jgi:hypothetical protein
MASVIVFRVGLALGIAIGSLMLLDPTLFYDLSTDINKIDRLAQSIKLFFDNIQDKIRNPNIKELFNFKSDHKSADSISNEARNNAPELATSIDEQDQSNGHQVSESAISLDVNSLGEISVSQERSEDSVEFATIEAQDLSPPQSKTPAAASLAADVNQEVGESK